MYERDEELMMDDLSAEERARLREAWETLEPSDDLVAAVVDIAHTTESIERGRRLPLWVPAVGLAAAVLLLAIFARRDEPPEPEIAVETPAGEDGETDDANQDAPEAPSGNYDIAATPALSQVEAARKRNELARGGIRPLEMGLRVRTQSAGLTGPISAAFHDNVIPPQSDDVVHRWIERALWEAGTERAYGTDSMSRTLRARVGKAFIDAAKLDPHVDRVVVELGTPETPSATTRLTVRVDRLFPGWMTVPNDVARALGLQQFEIRGGARLTDGNESIPGYRARARLRVAGRSDFMEEQEVFVHRARRPQRLSLVDIDSSDKPPTPVVELVGEVPPYISMTQGMSHSWAPDPHEDGKPFGVRFHGKTSLKKPSKDEQAAQRVDVPIPFVGPVHLYLDYDDERELWLPPLEIDLAWGTRVPLHVASVSWTADAKQCPPGSKFVASTVWRGNRARVGPAGVAFGVVGAGGVFDAKFRSHADLSGLRAHVTRPDGTFVWVDAQLTEPGGARGRLQAAVDRPLLILEPNGVAVAIHGLGVSLPAPPEGTERALDLVFDRLRPEARKRTASDDPTDPSTMELGLLVLPQTPWRQIAGVLGRGATIGIQTFRIQVDNRTDPSSVESIRLPSDKGLVSVNEGREELRTILQVFLRMQADGRLNLEWQLGSADATGSVVASILPSESWIGSPRPPFIGDDRIHKLRDWWKDDRYVLIDVRGERPVPASAIHEVLRACREAGVTDVRFKAKRR